MFDNVAVMIESNWFQKKYGTKIYDKKGCSVRSHWNELFAWARDVIWTLMELKGRLIGVDFGIALNQATIESLGVWVN